MLVQDTNVLQQYIKIYQDKMESIVDCHFLLKKEYVINISDLGNFSEKNDKLLIQQTFIEAITQY